jgi:hypothetical protein
MNVGCTRVVFAGFFGTTFLAVFFGFVGITCSPVWPEVDRIQVELRHCVASAKSRASVPPSELWCQPFPLHTSREQRRPKALRSFSAPLTPTNVSAWAALLMRTTGSKVTA